MLQGLWYSGHRSMWQQTQGHRSLGTKYRALVECPHCATAAALGKNLTCQGWSSCSKNVTATAHSAYTPGLLIGFYYFLLTTEFKFKSSVFNYVCITSNTIHIYFILVSEYKIGHIFPNICCNQTKDCCRFRGNASTSWEKSYLLILYFCTSFYFIWKILLPKA